MASVLSLTLLRGRGSDVAGFSAKYYNNKRTKKKNKEKEQLCVWKSLGIICTEEEKHDQSSRSSAVTVNHTRAEVYKAERKKVERGRKKMFYREKKEEEEKKQAKSVLKGVVKEIKR